MSYLETDELINIMILLTTSSKNLDRIRFGGLCFYRSRSDYVYASNLATCFGATI